jgi:hypothetical protein
MLFNINRKLYKACKEKPKKGDLVLNEQNLSTGVLDGKYKDYGIIIIENKPVLVNNQFIYKLIVKK